MNPNSEDEKNKRDNQDREKIIYLINQNGNI